MVSEADLLQLVSGLSELGSPGMVAYLGRTVGGLVLDEAWISSALVGMGTHVPSLHALQANPQSGPPLGQKRPG